MTNTRFAGSLALACIGVSLGCVSASPDDIVEISSALGGASGSAGTMALGGATGSAGTMGADTGNSVRAFTDSGGVHTVVYKPLGGASITELTGTPLANPINLGGNLMPHSSPWGYTRHDGPNIVLYIDKNGHLHERGSQDVDFALSFGINAPLAASAPADGSGPAPDVIGYVRSDNQSAIVYRSNNDHIIEVKSNFASSPPWVFRDVTIASGASVSAPKGSAFPYQRSDGGNSIVYIGSDNHVHELTSFTSTWTDRDLSTVQGTWLPSTDPWGYRRSDGNNAVVFVGLDGALHQISFFLNGPPTHQILPGTSPLGSLFNRPSGYVRGDGTNAVVYVSGNLIDKTLRELRLTGNWSDSSLPTPPGAPKAGQPFGRSAPGLTSSILYSGKDTSGVLRHYELRLSPSGVWGIQSF
jgi:hypothetical protein